MSNFNKKNRFAAILLALIVAFALVFTGCGQESGGEDGEVGSDGSYIQKPGQGATNVTFWINGDDTEIEVFRKLTDEFNSLYDGKIKVKLVQKDPDGYDDALGQSLASGSGPDVFYVGDSGYKSYAELGYLYDITDYVKNSQEYVVEDMWDNVIERYMYDVNTYRSGKTANGRYYGVPKDLGPTVIFYNETYFENAGIKCISVAKEDLAAFNAGTKADDKGKTKAQYGINGTVKEKGYFVIDGQKYFNNQIAMSWEETVECSNVVQSYMRTSLKNSSAYGYFTEWWFNYGWSVGGNCIQEIPSNDYDCGYYYDFTLMDGTKNYIVADDVAKVTVNGTEYKSGEIVAYKDKIDMAGYAGNSPATGAQHYGTYKVSAEVEALADQGKLVRLPSQRDAFTEFVRLAAKTNVTVDTVNGQALNGYGITPQPESIGGDAGKTNNFKWGNIAMLVDGRWNVTAFRKEIGNKFVWDVAPLPMYKQYDSEGNVTVHGVEAGHSGSVALCIRSNSKVPAAAWKFIEFCGGTRGQTLQAEAGFAIPLQKNIANSEVFLQSDKAPRNSKIFIRATEYETAGDWWFLKDKKWIDNWAGRLNGDVRNGKMTLTKFYNCQDYKDTFVTLSKYTANKK